MRQSHSIHNIYMESKTSPVFTKEMCFIAKALLRHRYNGADHTGL